MLNDPQLDLLKELLSEDPGDEAFLDVGRELVRRQQWEEAENVLSGGLEVHGEEAEGWALLARAALEAGHHDRALIALQRTVTDPEENPELARIEVVALEQAGRISLAQEAATNYLSLYPDDVVVQAARDRMEAPPPDRRARASDPYVSVERAEQYAARGRIDKAVRAYRRILYYNPEDPGVAARLRELQASPFDDQTDDLSDELTDPDAIPPDFTMPTPQLQNVKPEAFTEDDDDPGAIEDDVTQQDGSLPSALRTYMSRTAPVSDFAGFENGIDDDDEPTDVVTMAKVREEAAKAIGEEAAAAALPDDAAAEPAAAEPEATPEAAEATPEAAKPAEPGAKPEDKPELSAMKSRGEIGDIAKKRVGRKRRRSLIRR